VPDPIERLRFLRSAQSGYQSRVPWWWYSVKGDPPCRVVPRRLPPSGLGVLALALLLGMTQTTATRDTRVARAGMPKTKDRVRLPDPAAVWLVERTPQSEIFSNGLRIETRYATATAEVFRPGQGHLFAGLAF
jgi:hypothetical protein